LWGQYCLFLSVGIHDDLFDGQARRPSLVFVADELLIESQCAYAKYFREGPFWSIYRDCVRQTTKALVEADSQQRSLYASRKRMLGCYARAAAIFKIGSAAVCLKRRRMRSFSHIARFLEEMAIAGQILDDLEDMEEDLERGRYNFAANTLLRRRPQLKRRQARRLIAEGVMLKGMLAELVHEVRHRIENAAHAIAPLRLKAADRYIALRGRDVDELENILLRARAELLLRAI
jgi:hypothetical protein